MVQNKIAPDFPAFPGPGVLTRVDQSQYAQAITSAVSTKDALVIGLPRLSPVSFPTDNITQDQNTGRLNFTSADTPYGIREFREDDGEWLSKYKTLLPLPALDALVGSEVSGDSDMPEETLDAYALADSVYVVGVVYTNDSGQYIRQDGDWSLLAPDDTTFVDPDLLVIPIDPDRADIFLAMYDQSYVSVADAENYEDSALDFSDSNDQ